MTEYGPVFGDMQHDARLPLRRTSVAGRTVLERRAINLVDVEPLLDSEYPDVREMQRKYRHHAMLTMPLLREGEALGVISLLRREARAFTPTEVKLLETFADQAVIAIENVRLFNETQAALERQTASAEVLNVISNSMADARPVFDKICESCERLFAIDAVGIGLLDDAQMVHVEMCIRDSRGGPGAPGLAAAAGPEHLGLGTRDSRAACDQRGRCAGHGTGRVLARNAARAGRGGLAQHPVCAADA